MEDQTTKSGMSTSAVIGIAVLVAIVFGGGAYAYVSSKAASEKKDLNAQITQLQNQVSSAATATTVPSSSTSATADETANWKTYTNTKYGYSIKFPTDFSAQVGGISGETAATPDSGSMFVSNGKLTVSIDPDSNTGTDSSLSGVTVGKGLVELAQSAENRYKNQTPGSTEFIKFSYLKKSYSFATLAGFMEGTIENTKESENYGKYSETYRLQTKHGSQFFEVEYGNKIAKADKDSAEFKAGIDQMEKIIATIQFTK